jgi:peptidoglycan/xylan/chitin deacetylase (PgdA/CDA1 family)
MTGVLALAVGSWLGLGKPSVSQAKTLVMDAQNRIVRPEGGPLDPAGPRVTDFAPSVAQGTDASASSGEPWPRLNPEASAKRAWLLAEGPYHPPGDNRRIVTLTFDDGPFPETTPSVLRLLAKYKVHATFFVLGRYLDCDEDRCVESREVLKQVAAAGHLVGNHTRNHLLLTQLPRAQELAEIDDSAAAITKVIGKEPLVFRPPFGQVDMWTMQLLREKKQELVLWNVEAEDMKNDDAKAMFKSIKQQLDYAGGGIVLLHDIRPSSVEVLSLLLDWLAIHRWDPEHRDRPGYEIVDLPSFIKETAASPQPYADRIELEHRRSALHDNAARAAKKRRPLRIE